MMSPTKKWLLILAGVILAGLTIGGMIIYPQAKERWSAPLGPGLALPTYTPGSETDVLSSQATTTPLAQVTQEGDAPEREPTGEIPQTALTPTPTPAPLCGGRR